MSDLNWYVVQVRGPIGRAKEFLKLYGIPFYYPMLRELRPTPRKRISPSRRGDGMKMLTARLEPLFPGYMFVELTDGRIWTRSSFYRAGIVGVVSGRMPDEEAAGVKAGEASRPVHVPGRVIRSIKSKETDGAIDGDTVSAEIFFDAGDVVKVTAGPFKDVTGEVRADFSRPVGEIDSKHRITIFLPAFGRVLGVDLPVSVLAKVAL